MIWLIMFLGAALGAILGSIYMINSIAKFSFIRNKLAALVIVVGVFIFFFFTMGWINALTISIYTTMFFLIFGLIGRIFKKSLKMTTSVHWQGWLAIFASILYLVSGYYLCVSVVEKDYDLTTTKSIEPVKVAMIADSHIGTTFDGDGFAEHLKTIESQNPDILLIAGDFVDDGTKKANMEKACEALGEMNLKYGVWYSYGNHDEGYFNHRDFTADDLEKRLLANGVHVLADEYELIDNNFYLVGRLDKNVDGDIRKSMDDLLKDIPEDKYIIVMDHEPNDYDSEANSKADLVVSGHTHGGQMVPIRHIGVLVGANDFTYGYKRINDTDFIVTSGISDWALKFKTGCRSEYVIINIE
ncbi:metallophosphoesterase [Butyrivibrio fibrisolvens]|uniref:metallophosphoesterase n=1 Tax=Pseudobutyrivibrio ruminis TaxID=46206 RepID=UPI000420AA13|nr:metallophosphoesterase [Pseudobutyrivibrio ruminis]MDC7278291.1 metallophosphoesterase [Butyrivibrio fibrisolvens]